MGQEWKDRVERFWHLSLAVSLTILAIDAWVGAYWHERSKRKAR